MKDLEPWFILKSVPGIGNHLFKRLFERFKSPDVVFKASSEKLLSINGITSNLIPLIRRQKLSDKSKAELELTKKKGFKIVTMADPDYPPLLNEIPDPPPFFYVLGNLGNCEKNIAMVGTRKPTSYGISCARQLSSQMASRGFTIVSGMARGIDTAAHEGAIKGEGRTIAVLGSGLGNIYPLSNKGLFHKIIEKGAVISEFSIMAKPEAYHFPIRNRIISGLSLGTVVVEAARKSGSLITARLAAEQNREVFAVPGSIQSLKSAGTHALIKEGAKLVENAEDIHAELKYAVKEPVPEKTEGLNHTKSDSLTFNKDESQVIELLSLDPVHIDDIVRQTSMNTGKLSSLLLQLELKGAVKQLSGKLFILNS